jgi:hypothetical protein
MTRNFETEEYGNVSVRNAMLDVDGTNLVEGIEIRIGVSKIVEVQGYHDLEELSVEEVEVLILENS